MSLQLYQVDQRSYLLDFKNLVDDDGILLQIGNLIIFLCTIFSTL